MTDSLSAALGRVPSGIFVLTTRHAGQETAMLASWVMQAGFAPPMVTVALSHSRYIGKWIVAGAPFVLNLVAGGDKRLLRHFARGFAPGEPAFTGIDVRRSPQGAAVLIDALGHLECVYEAHVDSGDHRVFLARVVSGELARNARPMVHIRRKGAHY
jgi:flavin reductase (DIM6/NTAB) family NADH-FMN oxidoreductase RutF